MATMRPVPCLDHGAQHAACDEERPAEIDVHHLVPSDVVGFVHGGAAGVASHDVGEHIYLAGGLKGRGDRLLDSFCRGQIGSDFDAARLVVGRVAGAADGDNGCADGEEVFGYSRAQAAGGSGQKDHAATEITHVS